MSKEKENRFDDLMGAVRAKNVDSSRTASRRGTPSEHGGEDTAPEGGGELTPPVSSKKKDVQAVKTKKEPSSVTSKLVTSEHSDIQKSKHSNIQTSKAKSANPDYVRTTVYLPKKMHKKLKAIAIEEEKEMSSIVEELISAWLISQS